MGFLTGIAYAVGGFVLGGIGSMVLSQLFVSTPGPEAQNDKLGAGCVGAVIGAVAGIMLAIYR